MLSNNRRRSTPSALLEKAAQLRARAEAAEARARTGVRKMRTRRAILAGNWLFARYGDELERLSPELLTDFDNYLTRAHDRRAFGLSPAGVPIDASGVEEMPATTV